MRRDQFVIPVCSGPFGAESVCTAQRPSDAAGEGLQLRSTETSKLGPWSEIILPLFCRSLFPVSAHSSPPSPANLNGLKELCWGLFRWFYAYKFSKFLGHMESCGKDITFKTLGMPTVISPCVILLWWIVPSGTFTFFKYKSECVGGRGTGMSPPTVAHKHTGILCQEGLLVACRAHPQGLL